MVNYDIQVLVVAGQYLVSAEVPLQSSALIINVSIATMEESSFEE